MEMIAAGFGGTMPVGGAFWDCACRAWFHRGCGKDCSMSKVIKRTKTLGQRVAKGFLWLFTGAIPVFIAACYGPAEGYGEDGGWEGESPARGKVVDGLTLTPVRDIRVSCIVSGQVWDSTYSLPGDGLFELWHRDGQPCETLLFEDVDGAENGSFLQQEVPYDPNAGELTYELDPAE
jgi:hypothetical protein